MMISVPLLTYLYLLIINIIHIILTWLLFLDINECLTNPCGNDAACFNTPGSFTCQCATGYTARPSGCIGKETIVNDCVRPIR